MICSFTLNDARRSISACDDSAITERRPRDVTDTKTCTKTCTKTWLVCRADLALRNFGRKSSNLRGVASRPLHLRRHRGQDRVDIAAGLQSKDGATVVEQVEFDITSAPDQLFLAVVGVP